MNQRFTIEQRVEFSETDMSTIVHFSQFFRYMERAEHAFFRSLGLSVHQPYEDMVLSWPRVSVRFDFKRPLRFEDVFELSLTVVKLGRSSMNYRVGVSIDGREYARGEATIVCCDMNANMTSVPIPDRMRKAFEPFIENPT